MTDETLDDFEPPLKRNYARHLDMSAPFGWLAAGLRDFVKFPFSSLLYGFAVFLASAAIIYGLLRFDLAYILLPALAGFMVVGPALAVGLYEKSRLIEKNQPIFLSDIFFAKSKSSGQVLYIGVILLLVMMLWVRAAFLLYALFFGMLPFAGFEETLNAIVTTPRGWAFLGVGSAVGGLFAAFSFAISAFSIPMLLNERLDAFTAMGTSMALAWNNSAVAILWGAIVVALFAFSLATGLLGLIVVFPVLGHAAWHAYRAVSETPPLG